MLKNYGIIICLLTGLSAAGQIEIYNEDFQSGLPLDYTIVDNDLLTVDPSITGFDNAWVELVDPDNPLDTIMGSTSFFSPIGTADRWLITPQINLGSFGNILYWEARSHDASFLDGYDVYISTTDAQISSFTDTVYAGSLENFEWTSRQINLSTEGYDNVAVHLAFVNRTNNGFKLYIDDIRVEMEDPVGLESLTMSEIVLFPNPAKDLLNIAGTPEINSIVISSLDGRTVYKGTESQIDVSSLPTGKYFVMVNTNDATLQSTFVKF